MSHSMIKRFPLTLLVLSAGGIWALVLSGNGWVIPLSFFAPLSIVVGAMSLLLLLFNNWAWAWPGISLVAKRPDLRGTWKGVIRSSWRGSDGPNLGIYGAYIVVYQTYTDLHLRLLTRESQSITLAASLICEPDGVYSIHAVYRNEPKQLIRSRSEIHRGGFVLRVGGSSSEQMAGDYWTDRQTFGELELQRVSKERVGDFRTAESLKPPGE